MIDQTIAHYKITANLGQGGMGEVYRATDSKLGREVAVKVLPESFANDRERLARFQREAQVLASLNHSNIASIYGIEESGNMTALVLELVEGETLAECLKRGPVPVDQAVEVCQQLAVALEAAHEKGIIHRDLKPANVKLAPDGTVKVLDFGLAKTHDPNPESKISSLNPADLDSPTLTADHTLPGTLLGTAAYMAPEQARGKPVDKRADIWSFGCVLFECLTGQRAFTGETATEIIGAVLHKEPDWAQLPPGTPPSLLRIIRRCLCKDPTKRLRDIGEARVALGEPMPVANDDPDGRPFDLNSSPAFGQQSILLGGVCLVVGAVLAWIAATSKGQENSPEAKSLRTFPTTLQPEPLAVPSPVFDNPIALSPDGRRIAYGVDVGATRQLATRRLDQLTGQLIPHTDGASAPFFSPDGKWIGYFDTVENKLKKVSIDNGTVIDLCDTQYPFGASWTDDGSIIFSTEVASKGLQRVSENGGEPITITRPDLQANEAVHASPDVLPGARVVVHTIRSAPVLEQSSVVIRSLKDTNKVLTLAVGAAQPRYAPSGHLVYATKGRLIVQSFDLEAFMKMKAEADLSQTVGEPIPLVMEQLAAPSLFPYQYTLSTNGLMAFAPASSYGSKDRRLVWISLADGSETPLEMVRPFRIIRLSPNGAYVALNFDDFENIWIYDLSKEQLRQLTFGRDRRITPGWHPDGKRIAYLTTGAGDPQIIEQQVDGSGVPRVLAAGPDLRGPSSWSTNGLDLLVHYSSESQAGTAHIRVDTNTSKPPDSLLPGIVGAQHSPDGNWLAFTSSEDRTSAIYAAPTQHPTQKRKLTDGDDTLPRWAPQGDKLYFVRDHQLMAIPIEIDGPNLSWGQPVPVIPLGSWLEYDIHPDGDRILTIQNANESGSPAARSPRNELIFVENWQERLKQQP